MQTQKPRIHSGWLGVYENSKEVHQGVISDYLAHICEYDGPPNRECNSFPAYQLSAPPLKEVQRSVQ